MNTPDVSQLTGSLSELQDIIIPREVDLFPLAPGIYPIGLIFIFLAVRFVIHHYRIYDQNRYRREAIEQLNLLKKNILSFSDETVRIRSASTLPVLLKRTAITAFGRKNAAALSHDAWIDFLNSKTARGHFSPEMGQILSTCAWGSEDQIRGISGESFKKLISLMGTWIKTHIRARQ